MVTEFKVGDVVTTNKKSYWLYGGTGVVVEIRNEENNILLSNFKNVTMGEFSVVGFRSEELVLVIDRSEIKKHGYRI
jgi:hypothetical protein